MRFFDSFKTKKKNELEVSEKDRENVKKEIKEHEKPNKEYENKVEHSKDEYKIEYCIEVLRGIIAYRERIDCRLNIKCKELGIDTFKSLYYADMSMTEVGQIVDELERKVFNKTDREIENMVTKVVKNVIESRSDKQRLEDMIKAINYKKGVIFIKK